MKTKEIFFDGTKNWTNYFYRRNEFYADNEALILLLKGACFRQMKLYLQSQDCLRRVLQLDKQIKEDTYLLPFAAVELAMLARDQGNIPVAISLLEDAKWVSFRCISKGRHLSRKTLEWLDQLAAMWLCQTAECFWQALWWIEIN